MFTQIGIGAKCSLYIYHCGFGLAVTGRICDIGQSVLEISFQTISSSKLSYYQIFFLIAFLHEALIRNITVILCINCIITICYNDDNVVINHNNKKLQGLILFFKFPMGRRKEFF
jgi:hypothetical protein